MGENVYSRGTLIASPKVDMFNHIKSGGMRGNCHCWRRSSKHVHNQALNRIETDVTCLRVYLTFLSELPLENTHQSSGIDDRTIGIIVHMAE